jgi:Mg2+ and Co2+ transporter CorA
MVPTLISSFFGMNIPNGIPDKPWAFYATIIGTGFATGALYWLMQRRRML